MKPWSTAIGVDNPKGTANAEQLFLCSGQLTCIRYIHLLEAELSQYRTASQTGTPNVQSNVRSEAHPVLNPVNTEVLPIHNSNEPVVASGTSQSPVSLVSNGGTRVLKQLPPEQQALGSSTRSFLVEVQQAPLLSSVAPFEEIATEPGAENGFFSKQFHDQIARLPSLSLGNTINAPRIDASWLQHFENVYFSYVHYSFPFLDPKTWYGKKVAMMLTSGVPDHNENLSKADPSALCMVDMVYALGALWSTRLEPQQCIPMSERFFLAAKRLVSLDDLEMPSLHLAQNLLLLTQYCITRVHRQRGFLHASMTYLGLAVRVCRSLKFPSIRYTGSLPSHDVTALKLWWTCIYYDIVFASTCGEPTIINALEFKMAERSQLGLKNSLVQETAFHSESYFENNVPLSLMLQDLCAELHEASSDYQDTLQGSLFSGNFSSLQRHETNLTRWYARLPVELKADCRCSVIDERLLLEQRMNLHIRYHYTQILLYRPAISSLLKLQARPGSVEASGDHSLQGSFALNGLKQFAWKCLEAAVRTVDLLRTYQESGREIMIPERNFTPFCFYLYNSMLVMIAARCCADDGFYEIDLHTKWHQALKILQRYQLTSKTIDIPFRFFDVINERLFRDTNEGEPASNLLQFSESWNMFDWYQEDDTFGQNQTDMFQNQAAQTVDTMSSQWLGSFLTR
ncbi:hypothetical protein LTR84_004855 [Exophiala bonariae]|uniref:Xylanolytic transcriptional activator regulatory domain-containing protein n=1 Tax=Exophiala bonariae TaxID=1690606 RepID=A0AAV9NRU2_9EURO|nr:hypothetical protein LTR84_004855 [Exophiala bonariae]